eukprot:scaffold23974_cov52-Attheya_sp.AAC.7
MANDMCTRRLTRELQSLLKSPIRDPRILAMPNESNILEWHYVVEGSAGTPYEGGHYHGKLIFPKEYPMKPPSVIMLTPSGRFKPNRRLCLSMSDFHPESWNPLWSVSTILTGLYSFMIDVSPTLGSVDTSEAQKRRLARQSLDFNVRDTNFRKLFPELVELHQQRLAARRLAGSHSSLASESSPLVSSEASANVDGREDMQGIMAAAAGIAAVFSIWFAMRFL